MLAKDTFKHQGLRKQLVEELRVKGIVADSVLAAIERVPRHLFMDTAFLDFAYKDQAFPIGSGQTISQPYTVALQTQLLELKKGDKVLEIGTGSGYQTAVLCEMGVKVWSIERQRPLYLKTIKLLKELTYTAKTFYGDGYVGLPTFAPFNKIIVTAGAPFVPPLLLEQLATGGILVLPVGDRVQKMLRITKQANGELVEQEFGDFQFVPLLENKQD